MADGDRKTLSGIPEGYLLYLFLIISVYLLFFEEPLNSVAGYTFSVFRNLLSIPAILVFILTLPDEAPLKKIFLNPYIICGAVFVLSGMAGYFIHHYRGLFITVNGLYEHIRVWLSLYLFYMVGKKLSFKKYSFRLYTHTAFLSVLVFILCIADHMFHIWPRQNYKHGIGSLQLFFGHPSNLGAKAVFLIGMLLVLYPFIKEVRSENTLRDHRGIKGSFFTSGVFITILIFADLLICIMTLRVRIFGFAAIFIILFIYMIAFKRKLHIPVIAVALAAAFYIGRKRLYNFYFNAYAKSIARGKLFYTALRIAREGFPFGSGFGTFGSRVSQVQYSPLYYKYSLMNTIGLMPTHPNYICDSFIACIIAESGWLGTAAYAGIIICILIRLFRSQRLFGELPELRFPVFAAFSLIIYELLEMLGTLSFSEIYSVLISIALGLALSNLDRDQT